MVFLVFIALIFSLWLFLEKVYPNNFIGNDSKSINNILDYIFRGTFYSHNKEFNIKYEIFHNIINLIT